MIIAACGHIDENARVKDYWRRRRRLLARVRSFLSSSAIFAALRVRRVRSRIYYAATAAGMFEGARPPRKVHGRWK